MPGRGQSNKRDLDDIQVLGDWNFNIQTDTPLVWLRSGALDRYLMRFTVHSHFPSTAGLIFHAEADGPGFDGVSFWIERKMASEGEEGFCRYVLSGDGLESKALSTKRYPDPGGEAIENVEVLVQGYTACIFVRDRKVQIKLRTNVGRGSICFYNSTKATEDGMNQDINFSGVRITALRRGPLEVAGTLKRREARLKESVAEPEQSGILDEMPGTSFILDEEDDKAAVHPESSVATTAPGDSPEQSLRFTNATQTAGGDTFYPTLGGKGATMYQTASSPGFAKGGAGSQSQGFYAAQKTLPVSFQKKLVPFGGKNATFYGAGNLRSTTGRMGSSQPTRLRPSASDGALRKSGGVVAGLSSTMTAQSSPSRLQPTRKAQQLGGTWAPLAVNPYKSEQQFVREQAIRPLPQSQSNACQDFIRM